MPPKAGNKKDLDPEELMKIKFRSKCLFRALGRLVMANAHWLMEGVDEYQGIEDVKRRVEQAVRGKAKKRDLLNINDKALLNKNAAERTDQEKQYLYRILGGLKCFKRYPKHVKRKLAALTYFKYYSPGRVIVRQHQEAHALYFLVSGDVVVSILVYDELLQKYQSVEVGVMHPGDMFGEVSLLHNIPRTATVTTAGHCELLALMKEDFKNVLQGTVQKQWDEVKKAMSAFTYFDALDDVALREGCIVARLKSYAPNETILGDGAGVPNFVYFTLSGRCQMIESIQVSVTKRLGREFYSLHDPPVIKEESSEDFNAKYFGVKKSSGAQKPTEVGSQNEEISKTSMLLVGTTSNLQKIRKSSVSIVEPVHNDEDKEESLTTSDVVIRDLKSSSVPCRSGSVRLSVIPEFITPKIVTPLRTYFMQVCIFNPGSSFGFGENMRNRRIVALTNVDCLLLPKMWLLQRNTANIWTRIQHYLEKKIPNTKQLFKEFVSARRWQEYKDELVEEVVSRSNTVNYTTVHDVPYSIRMNEMFDI